MDVPIQQVVFLLLIAAIVAMTARKLRLPYIAGLVLAGIGLSFLPLGVNIPLTKELVFYTLLPPLIFEAAFYIEWKALRKDLPVIAVFATLGVALSAAVTAWGMHSFAGWEWSAALAFGTLIAATDPISVIATFKEAGVHGRLRLLVETESLINDGTAAVAFAMALAFAAGGGSMGAFDGLRMLLMSVAGGVTCGAVIAWLALQLAGRTKDHLIEITFTTIAAWGSFLVAEHFHVSGIIACMTAGLILGNTGSLGSISDEGHDAVTAFWEYAAFVANSMVFLLIGMHVAQQEIQPVWSVAATAILFVTLGRAVAIYPCAQLFRRSKLKVKMKHQHVLFWGGLRGALALALALGLPEDIPHRDAIITVAFCVVTFSVFVQATTMEPLLRRFREIPGRRKKN